MYYEQRYQMYAAGIVPCIIGAIAIGLFTGSWLEGVVAAIVLSVLTCVANYVLYIKPSKEGTCALEESIPKDASEVPDSAYASVMDVLSYMILPFAVTIAATGYTITYATGYWIPVVLFIGLVLLYRFVQYVLLYIRVLGVSELKPTIGLVTMLSIIVQYFLMDVSFIGSWGEFITCLTIMLAVCVVRNVLKDVNKKD